MCASKVITDLTWVSKDGCRQQVCVGFVPAHIVIKRLKLFKKNYQPFPKFPSPKAPVMALGHWQCLPFISVYYRWLHRRTWKTGRWSSQEATRWSWRLKWRWRRSSTWGRSLPAPPLSSLSTPPPGSWAAWRPSSWPSVTSTPPRWSSTSRGRSPRRWGAFASCQPW